MRSAPDACSCALTPTSLPQIPYSIVFTKVDKRKKGAPPALENIAAFEAEVLAAAGRLPPTLVTSSRAGSGKTELLAHIAQLREFW
jgi:hypothetical protein